MTKVQTGLLRLKCGVQHYAWGDPDFIPKLIDRDNAAAEPYAELWMGDHPDLPSSVNDGSIALSALIAAAPEKILGAAVVEQFGAQLPYLFKVLAAAAPLSIQAHPSKAKAEAGFAQEDAAGVPRDDATRTYRDVNHKPELIAALTDFYALRGFRPLEEIAEVFRSIPEFRDLTANFEPHPEALRDLYGDFMDRDEDVIDRVLGPWVERLKKSAEERPFDREEREYWVLDSHRAHSKEGHYDRGLFSIYLLNLIHLRPRQATYLPAGILHAYLHGVGVELMANSNNVLRGGLTRKHVDVPELLQSVIFTGETPVIVNTAALSPTESVYRTPFEEFELRRIEVTHATPHHNDPAPSAEILIVIAADDTADAIGVTANVTATGIGDSAGQTVELEQGDVLLVTHETAYSITANTTAPLTLYKATVPVSE